MQRAVELCIQCMKPVVLIVSLSFGILLGRQCWIVTL